MSLNAWMHHMRAGCKHAVDDGRKQWCAPIDVHISDEHDSLGSLCKYGGKVFPRRQSKEWTECICISSIRWALTFVRHSRRSEPSSISTLWFFCQPPTERDDKWNSKSDLREFPSWWNLCIKSCFQSWATIFTCTPNRWQMLRIRAGPQSNFWFYLFAITTIRRAANVAMLSIDFVVWF